MKFAKIKAKLASIVASALALVTFTVSASAYDTVTQPLGNYRLANGISAVNYYITDSVLYHSRGTEMVNAIDAAAYSWVYTGYGYNPLYMYRTYNFLASNIDIYSSDVYTDGFQRLNYSYWVGNSNNEVQVDPTQSNWTFVKLTIFINMHPTTDNKVQRTFAYGMGKAFGMADNTGNPDSIMCDFNTTTSIYLPGLADHNGLNAMYAS